MQTMVRCEKEAWDDGIQVMVFQRGNDGTKYVAQDLQLRILADGERIQEPTLRLENQEAQFLMDELWRCGLRPSEGTGSAGSLAATEKHLRDMQAIAMGLLKKDGVNVG